MKKKQALILICVIAAVLGLTAAAATAAGGAGTQGDPLVTLSYLNDTFTGQIMDKVDGLIAQRNLQLGQGSGAPALPSGTSSGFAVVTLEPGQSLYGEAGCEVLLRSGEAACAASAPPGLVDATSGGSLAGGAPLEKNHLYLMTDSRTLTSDPGAVLLVRGAYIIG